MHYVYILKCADGSYYTGCTQELTQRLERHNRGYVDSTQNRLPVELILHLTFKDKYKAYDFEKYLKSGSGIAFRNKRLV
jgi:putative endonuclease